MKWFKAQLDEISASPALRRYGLALALTHVLTLMFWRGGSSLLHYPDDPVALCWSFLPGCRSWRGLWQVALMPIIGGYWLATAAAVLSWSRRWVRSGYWTLLIATAFKFALISIDYREMGNYHYMPGIVLLVFLFAPRKVEVIRYVIVGFYLAAGVLKFNREWLSGAAIFGHPLLHGRWLVLGCLAVVGLEMIGSFGLLARSRTVFYATLAAFAVFHLFSWHIVGFFYPLVMFALLSIYPLTRGNVRCGAGRSTLAILAVFALMQIPPAFSRTDSALTGEKRLTSLNMFDARIQCFAHVWISRVQDGVPNLIDINYPLPNLGVRIHCEPWVYAEYARSLCAAAREDEGLRSVRVQLQAKRSSDLVFQTTMDQNFECGSK